MNKKLKQFIINEIESSLELKSKRKNNGVKYLPEEFSYISPNIVPKIEKWGGFDFNRLKHLGEGTQGQAYDMGGGKVLKITEDESEALASQSLVGYHHTNTTKYFKIAKSGMKLDADHMVYYIIQEKLPLKSSDIFTEQEISFIDEICALLNPSSSDGREQLLNNFHELVYYGIFRGNHTDMPDRYPLSKESLDRISSFFVQIVNGLGFLDLNGIIYSDVWTPNVMFRNKETPVLIDLGYSATEREPSLKTIKERRNKTI